RSLTLIVREGFALVVQTVVPGKRQVGGRSRSRGAASRAFAAAIAPSSGCRVDGGPSASSEPPRPLEVLGGLVGVMQAVTVHHADQLLQRTVGREGRRQARQPGDGLAVPVERLRPAPIPPRR